MSTVDAFVSRVAWRSSLLASVLSCGGGSDISKPTDETTSINVFTTTDGVHIDADGYGVRVDGGTPLSIGSTDTLSISDLQAGPHTVVLDGWAENCTPTTSPSRRFETTPGDTTRVEFVVSCTALPALIAQVRTVGVGWDLDGYLLALDGGEPELITLADTLVYDVLPSGEHEVSLTGLADNCGFEGPNPRLLAVAPGSTAVADFEVRCSIAYRILFGSFDNTLYVMDSDGTDIKVLTEDGSCCLDHAWSPDGSHIAFWRRSESPTESVVFDLMVMNSDGSGAMTIYTTPQDPLGMHWSPDGTRIAFGLGAPDAINDPDSELYVIRADGADPILLSDEADNISEAAWAPDGFTLAFTSDASDIGQSDVYLIRSDGTGLRPLAATDGYEAGGLWSPNGASIAIRRTIDGSPTFYDGPSAIYLIDPDGTNQRQLTPGPSDRALEWSPDGSKLLFASGPLGLGKGDVHVINADGSDDVTLLSHAIMSGGHYDATWSPDGRAIAWLREWDENAIWIMNADGSGKTRIGPSFNTRGPQWEPALPGSQ